MNFSTDMFSKVGFGVNYDDGTVINLVPPVGVEPELADRQLFVQPSCAGGRSTVSASMRRICRRRSTIRTASAQSSTTDFAHALELQFTKEMSLRLIVQHEETEPTALSRLEHEENLNLDVLFRYVLESLFGALCRFQQQREQSAARRYAAGPAARAYRGARARRPTVVREVLVSLAALIKRWRCSDASMQLLP